ncbi:AMP nucleosidase [Natronocella acetinitrilica]|uniref:AMP nucleosidase n=1 Tax=Natronocella acetinitrilica TaxID=414046 RepID=A0AAE3G7Q5_9GAMM|nr:AMP nucleosidase [Natronocella acetinitrilica]MCP1675928.1 AMP nucleosidase [Natronocella acetinitrilica]
MTVGNGVRQPGTGHGAVRDLKPCHTADEALQRVEHLYTTAVERMQARYRSFVAGESPGLPGLDACYPYVGLEITADKLVTAARPTYGALRNPGFHGTTVTRPDLFRRYLHEQFTLLLRNHGVPLQVGVSNEPIPLPFVIEDATADLGPEQVRALSSVFHLPNLGMIDDRIANGTYRTPPGEPWPLALFPAQRVDLAVQRLHHYTGTDASRFQGFVLFTNYQRYVDDFIRYGLDQIKAGGDYTAFVEPGDVITDATTSTPAEQIRRPKHLPPMPAYHLVRPDGLGVTLINIGVGPSNAKTITDHLAVLRPHCWLMIGHCGGLRRSQLLGDYVLAHAYMREDHVLDQDLPLWVPVPPIAEIQVALQEAVAGVTGLEGMDTKIRLRTGTVASTDNRNWEFRYDELYERFSQSRAIAVDMESATIAANGFRLRVPYGTLLCVSDKPMHGELKLRSMADAFYRTRVNQHLFIGLETVRLLKEAGIDSLHSRKLRSFDEPAFR